ncbi:MAG: COX15/CtaA family protein [Betaproteobacteria bacterium]|nr:COX15/CtaA family protein [Betaproteobacteria bacterium]
MKHYRLLVSVAAVLAFVVVVVGAFVRLSDAGLGCPDWPGCYGKLTPSAAAPQIARAVNEQGGTFGPVSLPKAWKEMGHRYLAGTLGLLILAIALIAWRRRRELGQSPWLASAIVLVVALQGALGMWTVTLLLKPAIVTGHLIGGMTTLALLTWLALAQRRYVEAPDARRLRGPAVLGLAVLAVQIVLGGWVSTNYAALACPDLPLCHGQLVPPMDFRDAFHVIRDLGMSADGQLLPLQALVAIHWTHRMFALVAATVLGWAAWRALRVAALRPLGILVALALALQISLGVANVLLDLPLALAAAHNAGAALLLVSVIVLNFFAFRGAAPRLRRS